jgi:hypothetical protein
MRPDAVGRELDRERIDVRPRGGAERDEVHAFLVVLPRLLQRRTPDGQFVLLVDGPMHPEAGPMLRGRTSR